MAGSVAGYGNKMYAYDYQKGKWRELTPNNKMGIFASKDASEALGVPNQNQASAPTVPLALSGRMADSMPLTQSNRKMREQDISKASLGRKLAYVFSPTGIFQDMFGIRNQRGAGTGVGGTSITNLSREVGGGYSTKLLLKIESNTARTNDSMLKLLKTFIETKEETASGGGGLLAFGGASGLVGVMRGLVAPLAGIAAMATTFYALSEALKYLARVAPDKLKEDIANAELERGLTATDLLATGRPAEQSERNSQKILENIITGAPMPQAPAGKRTVVESSKQTQSAVKSDRISSAERMIKSQQEYGSAARRSRVGTDFAMNFFKQKGYSDKEAAAIVGNLKAESSMNPVAIGDKGAAFGLAQWRDSRLDDLKAFAKERGTSYTDPSTQLEFVHHELQGKENRAFRRLRAASESGEGVEKLSDVFARSYERPATNKETGQVYGASERAKYASEALEAAQRQTGSAVMASSSAATPPASGGAPVIVNAPTTNVSGGGGAAPQVSVPATTRNEESSYSKVSYDMMAYSMY